MPSPDPNLRPFFNEELPLRGGFRGCKVDRLYRMLLSPTRGRMSWYGMAKLAQVSYGWAHRLLSGWERGGLIEGCAVLQPAALFELWSQHRVVIYYREYHVQRPRELLKDVHYKYAYTKYFAEYLIGEYLFPSYFDFYIPLQDYEQWHGLLSNRGYVGQGNVRLLISDEHVFWEGRDVNGWPVVSVQQLIVDLLREGGGCREAAENLLARYYPHATAL